uniref:Uncharacterized protein n=1 Tax=Rhipicephalus pulchellus TaxID=72859 RepID=L7M0E5_RHIPC
MVVVVAAVVVSGNCLVPTYMWWRTGDGGGMKEGSLSFFFSSFPSLCVIARLVDVGSGSDARLGRAPHAAASSVGAASLAASSSLLSSTLAFFSGVPLTSSSSLCFSAFSVAAASDSLSPSAAAAASPFALGASSGVFSASSLASSALSAFSSAAGLASSVFVSAAFSFTGDASTSFFTSSETTSACSVLGLERVAGIFWSKMRNKYEENGAHSNQRDGATHTHTQQRRHLNARHTFKAQHRAG